MSTDSPSELSATIRSKIGELVQQHLSHRMPDALSLEKEIRQITNFSNDETRHLIYQIVRKVNRGLFPPITKMELILTEGCNLGCSYCFEKDAFGYKRIPTDIAIRAVDLLFDYSGNQDDIEITFFGGEPTLNFPLIQQVVEYVTAKQTVIHKKVEYHMTSNGILIDDSMARFFAEHGIRVLLSIDGLQETHDRFRIDKSGKGTFDRVMKGMHILKRYQPWIGTKMTVMPDNVHRLLDDVVGLADLGINQFIIGPATGIIWADDALTTLRYQLTLVWKWYQAAKDRSEHVRIAEFDDQSSDQPNFGCQAGRNSISISINGEISPCARILALENKRLLKKLGDVHYGLTHLVNRHELNDCSQLRRNCERQGIAEEYDGGCFAKNFEDNGDLFQPSLQRHRIHLIERSTGWGVRRSGMEKLTDERVGILT